VSCGLRSIAFQIALALAGIFPGSSAANPPEPARAFDALVDEALRSGVPGFQVYVKAGGREWSKAAGYSSLEEKTPMLESQRMRVASITKLLTYAATMEFVKRGRLRLDQRATSFLPSGELNGILLEHQSGLHNFNGEA
jgi:D-alanyl-D-alanine carboxypeptidase